MGFDAGVVSGANPFYKEYFFLSDWALGWSVGCLTFGAMLGNAIAGPLADRFGRKPVLLIAALFYSVSAIFSAMASDFNFFIVARMLGGVAVGLALLIAPIYIAEIAPPKLRGRFVSFNQLNIVIGFSAVFFSNYYFLKMAESDAFEFINKSNCWRWMLGAEALPAILYFLLLFLVPRSPRWLAQHGRYDESLEVLGRVLEPEEAAKSLGEIKENIASDEGKRRSVAELFARRMSYIMFIALGLGFFQQITGINAIFFYAPTIFEKTGIPQANAFLQTIIIGLVNLGFTVIAIVLIDRTGRKTLLMLGTTVMAICLLTTAWAFHSATFQLTAAYPEELNEEFSAETIQSLAPLTEESFDNEKTFVAEVRRLIEPTVLGNSDFHSGLPASLKATVDTFGGNSFVNAATFQAAMIDAVTEPVFIQEWPLAGKNALRALKKRSFDSRDEFFSAMDNAIDRSTLDGHVATLVKQALNVRDMGVCCNHWVHRSLRDFIGAGYVGNVFRDLSQSTAGLGHLGRRLLQLAGQLCRSASVSLGAVHLWAGSNLHDFWAFCHPRCAVFLRLYSRDQGQDARGTGRAANRCRLKGVARSQISNWSGGARQPSSSHLPALNPGLLWDTCEVNTKATCGPRRFPSCRNGPALAWCRCASDCGRCGDGLLVAPVNVPFRATPAAFELSYNPGLQVIDVTF